MSRFKRRSTHVQASYTGVSAFSSDPAPNDGALAAASFIGEALKANNHNAKNLTIPSTQVKRSNSIRSIAAAQPPLSLRSPSLRGPPSRSGSLKPSTSQRRLQNHRSTPNLSSRRSISESNSYRPSSSHSNNNIPRTIKRYVPGANGLVAVEVPNPKHPDNQTSKQQQQQRSVSLQNSLYSTSGSTRRSSNTLSPMNYPKRSITRSESKVLSDGTRVETTVTEVYVPENDVYENFDTPENHDLKGITEAEEEEEEKEKEEEKAEQHSKSSSFEQQKVGDNGSLITELEHERVEEERIKLLIFENEELEKTEREHVFSSTGQPMEEEALESELESTVIISNGAGEPDIATNGMNDNVQNEAYTLEERRIAEERLDELVALKEKEILDKMIQENQLKMAKIENEDESIKTEFSNDSSIVRELNLEVPNSQRFAGSDTITESVVSEDITKPIYVDSTPSSTDQVPFKSMAQHIRGSFQPKLRQQTLDQQQSKPDQPIQAKSATANDDSNLIIPKRSPTAQAQIDVIQSGTEQTPTKSSVSKDLETASLQLRPRSNTESSTTLSRRKSALKNANDVPKYHSGKTDVDPKTITLTTAENTRLNAMASSSNLSLSKPQSSISASRRESFNGSKEVLGSNSANSANAAAMRAAHRLSGQPDAFSNQQQRPGKQRTNPKVEEAKRKILANSPAQSKAKELYRLSKSRAVVKEADLQALADEDIIPRRSSFEKIRNEESRMSKRLTLRENLGPEDHEPSLVQHSVVGQNNTNYKSRFSNDSDSDYEIPIVSKKQLQSQQRGTQKSVGTKPEETNSPSKKKSGSKIQKFFTEPANKRFTSTASHATTNTTATKDTTGEKKSGFKKLKKLFGSKK